MASTDARPIPIKNTAFRAVFPILDADGDLVTGATGLDSEVSKDQGTFADCTNEATEIATSSGMYYLDLTSTEMNADCVAAIIKTSTVGAKTTVLVLYPEETGDINVDVTAYGGTAGTFASGRPEVNTTHAAGTAWNSGAIGASTLAADTITDAKVAADVTIASVTGAVGSVTGNVGGNVTGSVGSVATGGITAASFAADAITAAKLAADVTTELQNGLATAASLTTVEGKIDTIDTNVDSLLTRITATLFAGITSLSEWLGLIAGKQTGNTTARTELRATGAGSGTYDETTDSQEALRDRGDAAWVTATGFSTLDAAGVRTAVGLASANLDTQLDAIPTVGETADGVWDELLSGHAVSGSAGEALSAAGTAGDPWTTALPGAYGAGSAGKIIGDNINAAVSTRATPAQVATELATYDGPTKAELDSAVAPLSTAVALTTVDTVVDSILALLSDARTEPGQGAPPASEDPLTKLDYLYKLARNRITQSATELKIYADDGTTVDHKSTVSDDGSTYDRGELGTGA